MRAPLVRVAAPLSFMGLATLFALCALASSASAWWRQGISNAGNYQGGANAVIADGNGDAIAVGGIVTGTTSAFTAIKFSGATGIEVWRQTINGAGYSVGEGRSVVVDNNRDVIAAGAFYYGYQFSETDGVVTKVSGDTGVELWRWILRGTATGPNCTNQAPSNLIGGMAVNANGDAIVAGVVANASTGSDIAVVKLSGTTGTELWRREIDGVAHDCADGDGAAAVALDANGDVVVVGGLDDNPLNPDGIVIKLSGTTGAELWRRTISSAVGFDSLDAVRFDSNGDVIVAGLYSNNTRRDIVVLKLSGDAGTDLWHQEINASGAGNDYLGGITIDSHGDVIIAGLLENALGSGTPCGEPAECGWSQLTGNYCYCSSFFVGKLAGSTGEELWQQLINGTLGGDDQAIAVTVDANQDAIAAGILHNKKTGDDFAVVKFSGVAGTELWRQTLENTSDVDGDAAYAVTVDGSGNPIAAGFTSIGPSGYDFAVDKFSADGSIGTLRGEMLLVSDGAANSTLHARVVSGRRKITVRAKDSAIVTPLGGTLGDPRLSGAKLRLLNPTTGESASFSLPAFSNGGRWIALGHPRGSKGYSYTDPGETYGPCKLLVVKRGKLLKAECSGEPTAIPFSLDAMNQGTLMLSVQLGDSEAQCVQFGGGTVTKDVGTGTSPNGIGVFTAKKAAAPLGVVCPVP